MFARPELSQPNQRTKLGSRKVNYRISKLFAFVELLTTTAEKDFSLPRSNYSKVERLEKAKNRRGAWMVAFVLRYFGQEVGYIWTLSSFISGRILFE
ncbi:hypothetical protein NPIL_488981 [Nephila pilipes]|uniref:Uncharacterized protein n=1 Tax=Nephila pilipes TaxID=299642 RepID=A0A8X6N3B2_NEPPI|nr:hypothetical protein NPIL_488981 [Nephila pilipes]